MSVVLALVLLLAGPASAATPVQQQLSDAFVRYAVTFMGYAQNLESDDPQVLAATLLDAAVELNPQNIDAWALRVELAETSGDPEAYDAALKGYLATGVRDDRARLRLIIQRLAKNNTLDAQLQDLEDLLASPAGRGLAGPLRSRLASHAASLAGELFDESARRKWAVEAARADTANLEAAQTMLDLVTSLGGDSVRRGTAMVNVIRASPLDPGARVEFASLLAAEAAFERAAQQYSVAATRLSREPLTLAAYRNWAQCLAMVGQDDVAMQLVGEIEKLLQPVPEEGEAEAEAEADEAVPVPLTLELVRLAILADAEDPAEANKAMSRIAEQLNKQAEGEGKEEAQEPADGADKNGTPADQLALIAAVLCPDLEQAEQYTMARPDNALAAGWIALRKKDLPKAESLLRPLADKQSMAACGLAMAMANDSAGRARLLQGVIRDAPGSMAALVAGRELLQLRSPVVPTPKGQALVNLMGKYAESFWLVDLERTPWLEVRMKIDPQRIQPMQPIVAELTVWNTTRYPMAIGERGPISQQAMVILTANSSGRRLPPNPPIVVDLGREITLNAGERLVIDARLDYHQFGSLRAANPGVPFVFDAQFIVNPSVTRVGSWLPSGIGNSATVRNCLVQSKPAKAEDLDRWIEALSANDPMNRIEALQRLANLDVERQPDLLGAAIVEKLSNALVDTWKEAAAEERAWFVLNAVKLTEQATTYPKLYELASISGSKSVWLAMLISQGADKDAEILNIAIGRQDLPKVARFAERQKRLLRDHDKFVKEQEERALELEASP